MNKLITLCFTAVGCLLAVYFLWTPNAEELEDENSDHQHENFIHFTKELAEANLITTEKASQGNLKEIIRAPAYISIIEDQRAHILPKVSGIVLSAYKNLGEEVFLNEVVAVIESKEIAEAKSNYLSLLKKEQLAAISYQREKNLLEKRISSLQDYHNSQAAHEEYLIDLELARQKLLTLGLTPEILESLPLESNDQLRLYELKSPLAGKVINRQVALGEFIPADREIYEIADLSKVWAKIHIFSDDRMHIKSGQTVNIKAKNHSESAKILYLSPLINPETRTSTALALLDNQTEKWFPGDFVQAEFILEGPALPLIIKKEAIQTIDGVDVVFITSEEGFEVRPITKGRFDEDDCEVIAGLKVGESYACKNTFLLKADLKKDEAEHMD